MDSFPQDPISLNEALLVQRKYTLNLYADLPTPLWTPASVPYLAHINPPLWELGHIAWFQEYFALRQPSANGAGSLLPSCRAYADTLFNSNTVAHNDRWTNRYPPRVEVLDYMQAVMTRLCEAFQCGVKAEVEDGYADGLHKRHAYLTLAHEDMHQEALVMTLAALNLVMPTFVPQPRAQYEAARDIEFAGGAIELGLHDARHFHFDNELPPMLADVRPFSIASQPVTATEFADFQASADYQNETCWSAAGNGWRASRTTPAFESKTQHPGLAAMHVNFFAAEAYCRAANRRLPTEAEWEFAAVNSPEFWSSVGDVWEWTASPFTPYAGFKPGIYTEYSEPWFHTHQVLKGASFATHPRMKYPQYRNFFKPERADMFCGFRTCRVC